MPMRSKRFSAQREQLVLIVFLLGGILGGCTWEGSEEDRHYTETGSRLVEVKLTDFAVDMSTLLNDGPTTLTVTNGGSMEHNFEIKGPDLEKKFDTPLKPGETKTMQVTIRPFVTYDVYCPVADHRARGMSLQVRGRQ